MLNFFCYKVGCYLLCYSFSFGRNSTSSVGEVPFPGENFPELHAVGNPKYAYSVSHMGRSDVIGCTIGP